MPILMKSGVMTQHESVEGPMTPNPVVLPETAPAIEAARKMRDAGSATS